MVLAGITVKPLALTIRITLSFIFLLQSIFSCSYFVNQNIN